MAENSEPPLVPPPLAPALPTEPDEHVVATIRRHPIGLALIYLEAVLAISALSALIYLVGGDSLRSLSGSIYTMITSISILVVALAALVLFAITGIYRQNRLIITDKAIIQTLQSGLFNRKVSRLSMADIEDVTTEQKGILPSMFGYGTLHIETSGELKNFAFAYTPDPNHYANIVLSARQSAAQDGS